MNRACQPRSKGGQPLAACMECHAQKMSCKTSENGPCREGHESDRAAGDVESEGTSEEEAPKLAEPMEGVIGEEMSVGTLRKPRQAAVQAWERLGRFRTSETGRNIPGLIVREVPASASPSKKRAAPSMEPVDRKRTRPNHSQERPTRKVVTWKGADHAESPDPEWEYEEEGLDDQLLDDGLLEYLSSEEESWMGQDTACEEGTVGHTNDAPVPERIEPLASSRVRLTVPELIIRNVWMNWEQDLRRAYCQCLLAQAMVSVEIPRSKVEVLELRADEEERFAIWRSRYLYQPADFEEERMEVGAFGLGE